MQFFAAGLPSRRLDAAGCAVRHTTVQNNADSSLFCSIRPSQTRHCSAPPLPTRSSSSANVSPPFAIELLGLRHKREAFACGVEPLDRYFREQVGQDVRRRVAACHVAREIATATIAGYYTLAAGSILLTRVPQALSQKLPRYPDVPVARLRRLAVGKKLQGRKLGAALLWDALERAARSEVVVYAAVVDAKDDDAVAFCQHHGFVMLSAETRQLLLPLARLREGVKRK